MVLPWTGQSCFVSYCDISFLFIRSFILNRFSLKYTLFRLMYSLESICDQPYRKWLFEHVWGFFKDVVLYLAHYLYDKGCRVRIARFGRLQNARVFRWVANPEVTIFLLWPRQLNFLRKWNCAIFYFKLFYF